MDRNKSPCCDPQAQTYLSLDWGVNNSFLFRILWRSLRLFTNWIIVNLRMRQTNRDHLLCVFERSYFQTIFMSVIGHSNFCIFFSISSDLVEKCKQARQISKTGGWRSFNRSSWMFGIPAGNGGSKCFLLCFVLNVDCFLSYIHNCR